LGYQRAIAMLQARNCLSVLDVLYIYIITY
jgi:hypothetical protein